MADLRVAQFTDPEDFLDAVNLVDHSFMNFALGSVLDSMDPAEIEVLELTSASRTLLVVYKGEHVLAALTNIAHNFAWFITLPLGLREQYLLPDDIPTVVGLLVSYLHSVIEPKTFDKLIGPASLVNALADRWIQEMSKRSLQSEAHPALCSTQLTYATLASIPRPAPHLSKYRIALATAEDVEVLAHFFVDFKTIFGTTVPIGAARETMSQSLRLGKIWVCRDEGELIGYCETGRMTAKTACICQVYVPSKHRRKGVAEAMTRAMTRYYLGAEPRGFEGAPDGPPPQGIKEQVVLNVAEEHVARVYKRCGFLLGDDARDPVTGGEGWYPLVYRGVQMLSTDM